MRKLRLKENLKFYRQRDKLTQQKLGKMVNVDSRTVSSWETGASKPSLEIIAQLCDIFDETADSLLFDDYK